MHIRTTVRDHVRAMRTAVIRKAMISAGDDVAKLEASTAAGGNVRGRSYCGKHSDAPQKVRCRVTI